MEITSKIIFFIAIYTVVWWFVFFLFLPIGIKKNEGEDIPIGIDRGAPKKSFLKIKVIATCLISLILTFFIYIQLQNGLIVRLIGM